MRPGSRRFARGTIGAKRARSAGCSIVRAVLGCAAVKLFLPQAKLEEWALSDKADLRDGKLVVTGDPGSYATTPAVHFVKLVSGRDEKKLVSRVKTDEQLQTLGAEQMMESVLIGETAYEVEPGYLTEVDGAKGDDKKKVSPEADLLAAFILNKL